MPRQSFGYHTDVRLDTDPRDILRPNRRMLAFVIALYTIESLMQAIALLVARHMHGEYALSFHVVGMWLNFLVSTSIITFALSFLAEATRQRGQAVSNLREAQLRNSHVVAIGGMAASAAHALSTLLSTVAVILDEFSDDTSPEDTQRNDLAGDNELTAYSRTARGQAPCDAADSVVAAGSDQRPQYLEK